MRRALPGLRDDQIQRASSTFHLEPMFEAMSELTMRESSRQGRPGGRSWVSDALQDLQFVVAGIHRPADRYLKRPDLHTDPAARGPMDPERIKPRNRLLVESEITKAGNLSVTFVPAFVDENGRVQRAREWFDMDGYSGHEIAQRPRNELIYVRGMHTAMDMLGSENTWPAYAELVRDAKDIAVAAHHAFWLEMDRLVPQFDINILSHPALLMNDREPVGFEIVDARREQFEDLARWPATMQKEFGIDPHEYMTAIDDEANVYQNRERLSRRFRKSNPLAAGLTPMVAQQCMEKLQKAVRYRVWGPEIDSTLDFRTLIDDALSGHIVHRPFRSSAPDEKESATPSPR